MVAATGLLKLDEAAQELETDELHVQRLIARGSLAGHRLGEQGHWRVRAEDLDRYVSGGAPGLHAPPMDGAWFVRKHNAFSASQFPGDVEAAATLSFPETAPKADDVTQRVTPAIQAVLDQRPREDVTTGAEAKRYRSRLEQFLVDELQATACTLTRQDRELKMGSELQKLYDSPQAYQRITEAAVKRLLQRKLVFKKYYRPGDNAKPEEQTRLITFLLPYADFAPQSVVQRVLELAF